MEPSAWNKLAERLSYKILLLLFFGGLLAAPKLSWAGGSSDTEVSQKDQYDAKAVTKEVAPREALSMARGLYVDLAAGGGVSENDPITQSGTAFQPPSAGGPLGVLAVGSARSHTAALGGLDFGYEWEGWRLGGSDSAWAILPAAEFNGYYLGTFQSGFLRNTISLNRIPEHLFNDRFPMDIGVLLANGVLSLHTPYHVIPYVGGSVGAAIVSLSGADSEQDTPPEPGINHFNSRTSASDWNLAVQARGGFRSDLTDRLWAFVEYRFLFIDSTNYTFGSTVYPTHVPTTPWHVHFGDMFYHLAVAGIGYSFGN
jgi:opacity protein-like surface antigen